MKNDLFKLWVPYLLDLCLYKSATFQAILAYEMLVNSFFLRQLHTLVHSETKRKMIEHDKSRLLQLLCSSCLKHFTVLL